MQLLVRRHESLPSHARCPAVVAARPNRDNRELKAPGTGETMSAAALIGDGHGRILIYETS